MSFVITTRSYRSRNNLHSTSTRVVLPDPTGPPMPTRKGGFRLVRWALLTVIALRKASNSEFRLRAKEPRILVCMPRRNNSQVGSKGGDPVGAGLDRMEHHIGDECMHGKKDFLSGNLSQRNRLQSGGHL